MQTPRHCASRSSPLLVILCGVVATFYATMNNYTIRHRLEGFYQLSTPLSKNSSDTANSKPRAILHIGPHKTSTTYIQSKILKTQDQFNQEGFYIPVAKTCPEGQQVQWKIKHFAGVAGHLKGDMEMARRYGCSSDPLADLQDSLRSIYSANDSSGVIFSSEEFDNLDDDEVAELAKILSNYQTTVVIYFRRKVEHIVSYYSEITKTINPLHSPLSFSDIFWKYFAILNPEAGPNDPVQDANGLCYKRLFETYSRHFGAQNLAVVHLNGLIDADKDPWEVFVQEVMMLSLGEDIADNDEAASKYGKEPTKINVAPSSISLSVAGYFYQWRWGNYTTATAIDGSSTSTLPAIRANSSTGTTSTVRSLLLPTLTCVLPFLTPLEEILPKECLDLQNMCKLWELQEQEALNRLAGEGSHLLYFDASEDTAGRKRIIFRDLIYNGPCQVDMGKLIEEHGKCAIATIPPMLEEVFNDVAAKIDKACSYDQA